jgi:hypothetical protein
MRCPEVVALKSVTLMTLCGREFSGDGAHAAGQVLAQASGAAGDLHGSDPRLLSHP